jgi:pyrroline-5-carboxylate reductase
MLKTQIVFIGGGNMAEAMCAGFLVNPNLEITVVQHTQVKADVLRQKYPSVNVIEQLSAPLAPNSLVILAIKPQQAKQVCTQIKPYVQECLIISVMAGITITSISNWLMNQRIIRTLPNTPALIQQGVSAIYASAQINANELEFVISLFQQIGIVYLAKDELEIDKIIPVTSSAVGFFYYFIEGLINSAVTQFGFSQDEARTLVLQVIKGSEALLQANPDLTISEQRQRVTSKKGATEQGILTFQQQQLHQTIEQAMINCYDRAREMSNEFA